MISNSYSQLSLGFRTKTFQQVLLLIYIVIWSVFAISPVYRPQWWLENYLIFAFFLFLILFYKKYQLSDLSYLFITIFLLLHVIGSHYGYSSVPIGFTIREAFGLVRNPYDRIVHFLFGFLFAYPIYELLKRYSSQKGKWLYILPINFIISLSAIYEILEAAVAWTYPLEQYDPFIGLQGDIWDGYKDMLFVSTGGILSTLIILFSEKRRKSNHHGLL
jgi:putative membrane protein